VAATAAQIACADPDAEVREAAWLPAPEAARRISQLPFAPMRDPAVVLLPGRTATAPLCLRPAGLDKSPVILR